jgi:hypothetical protein
LDVFRVRWFLTGRCQLPAVGGLSGRKDRPRRLSCS